MVKERVYMKKVLLIIVFLGGIITADSQNTTKAFDKGEWLRFRISYSNFLNAGNATLQVKETTYNGQKTYHAVGKGKTTGVVSWFFKVKDNYESYFSKDEIKPYKFIRKIDEGGYTKDKEIYFDHSTQKALVKDKKKDTEEFYTINKDVQDMVSALYYLRGRDLSNLKEGDEVKLTMFFDQTNYEFKLRFLGKETLKTDFGKVAAAKFRPLVQAGRVFKEEESLTVWVSDDDNKVPLLIKASLAVGSLRADLDAFKGLANPFPIIF